MTQSSRLTKNSFLMTSHCGDERKLSLKYFCPTVNDGLIHALYHIKNLPGGEMNVDLDFGLARSFRIRGPDRVKTGVFAAHFAEPQNPVVDLDPTSAAQKETLVVVFAAVRVFEPFVGDRTGVGQGRHVDQGPDVFPQGERLLLSGTEHRFVCWELHSQLNKVLAVVVVVVVVWDIRSNGSFCFLE